MSLLMVQETIDFNELKETLELTDGNLASHLKALEQKNYITVTKQFVGRKTMTTYSATLSGRSAFEAHLDALETIIRKDKESL